jgi:tetratricopeptide (TPR) repeat protein
METNDIQIIIDGCKVLKLGVTKMKNIKTKLRKAKNKKHIKTIEKSLGNLKDIKLDILILLFLAYRKTEAFKSMVKLVPKLPLSLRQNIMIQQQYGFALNRIGQKKKAIRVLEDIIKLHGNDSETCGILGRVYKDYWQDNIEDQQKAQRYLKKAIDTYLDGFMADFLDPYPAINAVTLMDIAQDKRRFSLLPIVTYAVKKKMKKDPNYWDYATLLELAILENNKYKAKKLLSQVLRNIREPFEPKTTANNIELIMQSKEQRGINIKWIKGIIKKLKNKR